MRPARAAVVLAVAAVAATARSGDEVAPSPPASARSASAETATLGAAVPSDVRVTPVPAAAPAESAGAPEPIPLAWLGGDPAKPLVAVFWSARCPVCRRYAAVLRALAKDFDGRARFAVVFPNAGETDDAVRAFLAEQNVTLAAASDRRQEAAARLGLAVTPTAVVVDATGTLRYRGPLDDDRRKRGRDAAEHLRAALDAVLAGRTVEAPEPRAFGSSVRRARADAR